MTLTVTAPAGRHHRPSAYRRFRELVATKIPPIVNTLWDAAEKRPLLALAAAAAGVSLGVAWWRPTWPVMLAFGYLAFVIGWKLRSTQLADLREERDALLRENGAKDLRLRQYEAAEASASTQEIHSIGDLGES